MTDARTKEADLAAIIATSELNYSIASRFPDDPIVVAGLAYCKATDAAFVAAIAEADAAHGFRRISAASHVRRTCAAADAAHAALRVAVEAAESRRPK